MDTSQLEHILRNRWFWVVPPIVLYAGVMIWISTQGIIDGRSLSMALDEAGDMAILWLMFGSFMFPAGFFEGVGISARGVEDTLDGFMLVIPVIIYLAYGYFVYRVKTLTARQLYTIAIIVAIFVLLTMKGCATMDYSM